MAMSLGFFDFCGLFENFPMTKFLGWGNEMTNLLIETIGYLTICDKTVEDVNWVGSSDGKYVISWQEFEKIGNVNYNSGYGSQEIAADLVVVGNNWWLSRLEYDGAEDWTFNTLPIMKKKIKPFNTVLELISK
jgi:hypothetical protein